MTASHSRSLLKLLLLAAKLSVPCCSPISIGSQGLHLRVLLICWLACGLLLPAAAGFSALDIWLLAHALAAGWLLAAKPQGFCISDSQTSLGSFFFNAIPMCSPHCALGCRRLPLTH
jgi:hypothetical protein